MDGTRRDPHGWLRLSLALAVALMGIIDLLSALLSHPPERLQALRHLVPTTVLDTSRTFTLLAGVLLLIAAWGLRRGKRRAFVAALFLCALSVPVNLLKALDVEEATVASALLFSLGVTADAFRVKSRELTLDSIRSGAIWILAAFGVYAVGGCWWIESHFGVGGSLSRAVGEAAYRLFGVGGPTLQLSHSLTRIQHRAVNWYLGSLPVIALTLVAGFALALLRPVRHRGRHRAQVGRVAELLRRYGDSSVGWFALSGDVDYFFSPNERAVLAYRFESGTLLVIGDPIGPAEEIDPLLDGFAAFCREHDWEFAFFQARPERLPDYRRRGWRALHVGEDPVIHTGSFTLEGSAMGEVRRAVRKLEEAGLQAKMFFPDRNPLMPGPETERILDELRSVSEEWLTGHPGEEKGFCMSRFDPHRLREVWVAVAWRESDGRAEAFLTWVPVRARRGWSLDLMRRRPEAPNGVMEFLVAKSVEAARAHGDEALSLSLSALAAAEGGPPVADSEDVSPRTREFLLRHLSRFYGFESLFRWKKKFQPSFEDRYLVYRAPLALPRVTLALVRAQSPGGLRSYIRRREPGAPRSVI